MNFRRAKVKLTDLQLFSVVVIIVIEMHELPGEKITNLKDLSFEQAEEVLRIQKKFRKKKVEQIAVELGFIELVKVKPSDLK